MNSRFTKPSYQKKKGGGGGGQLRKTVSTFCMYIHIQEDTHIPHISTMFKTVNLRIYIYLYIYKHTYFKNVLKEQLDTKLTSYTKINSKSIRGAGK